MFHRYTWSGMPTKNNSKDTWKIKRFKIPSLELKVEFRGILQVISRISLEEGENNITTIFSRNEIILSYDRCPYILLW